MDVTKATFPEDHFHLMYSRDAIMHIGNKDDLYNNVYVSNMYMFGTLREVR